MAEAKSVEYQPQYTRHS